MPNPGLPFCSVEPRSPETPWVRVEKDYCRVSGRHAGTHSGLWGNSETSEQTLYLDYYSQSNNTTMFIHFFTCS